MKKISVILTSIIALATLKLQAQEVSTEIQGSITPKHIGIAFNKTTNIIFPYAIKSVDRGSDEVLIQVAREVENILQVKGAVEYFTPTNLTVITAEGALYSFMLYSDESPEALNVHISPMEHRSRNVLFSKKEDHESRTRDFAERVATKKRTIKGVEVNRAEMSMSLTGLFIADGMLYFQLALDNSSNISYDTEQFRIYIRDRKRVKRTASQEIEMIPVHITGNPQVIGGQSRNVVVVALGKFTIPDKKQLIIQVIEKNGGRHLQMQVKNKHIVSASLIH